MKFRIDKHGQLIIELAQDLSNVAEPDRLVLNQEKTLELAQLLKPVAMQEENRVWNKR